MYAIDDFDKELGGAVCLHCRHYFENSILKCAAFPDRIPTEIWHGTHTEPYPGDNGILFDELSEEEMEARLRRMSGKEALAFAK